MPGGASSSQNPEICSRVSPTSLSSSICTPVFVSFCFLPKIIKSRVGHTWMPGPQLRCLLFILLGCRSEVTVTCQCPTVLGKAVQAGPPLRPGHSYHVLFVERSAPLPELSAKFHLFSAGPHPFPSLTSSTSHLTLTVSFLHPFSLLFLTCIGHTPAPGPLHVLFPRQSEMLYLPVCLFLTKLSDRRQRLLLVSSPCIPEAGHSAWCLGELRRAATDGQGRGGVLDGKPF